MPILRDARVCYAYRCVVHGCANVIRASRVGRLRCPEHATAEDLARTLCPTDAARLAYVAFGSLIPKGARA
jgi:hypothetical protein